MKAHIRPTIKINHPHLLRVTQARMSYFDRPENVCPKATISQVVNKVNQAFNQRFKDQL